MLAIISPAKTLDFESENPQFDNQQPKFQDKSNQLIKSLSKKSKKKLVDLMSISESLAELNYHRFQNWASEPNAHTLQKPAIYAFKGDVYLGLEALTLDHASVDYLKHHLRILSGMYGVLSPLDNIQPHRLEMGTRLNVQRKNNLYEFWGNSVTKELKNLLNVHAGQVLINLASNEYSEVVDFKALDVPVIQPIFKDLKNGKYKVLSFFAKKARGAMVRCMAEQKMEHPEELKSFNWEGYGFNPEMSSNSEWVFSRE